MNMLRCILLIPFATTLALGQRGGNSAPLSPASQPEALVKSLYTEVVARHPIGIPGDAGMKIFAPYLTKSLLHKIDVALACAADYDRQYPDPNLKPPFAWLEAGLFSGDDEQAEPRAFQIERTLAEDDGTFRVYVRLTWGKPPDPRETWRVAAIVVRESSSYAIDDIIFLKDGKTGSRRVDSRLSEYLSAGCDGARWVGRVAHP